MVGEVVKVDAVAVLGPSQAAQLAPISATMDKAEQFIKAFDVANATRESIAPLTDLNRQMKLAVNGVDAIKKKAMEPIRAQERQIKSVLGPIEKALDDLVALGSRTELLASEAEQARVALQLAEANRLAEEAAAKQAEASELAVKASTKEDLARADALFAEANASRIESNRAQPLQAVVTNLYGSTARSHIGIKTCLKVVDVTKLPRQVLEEAFRVNPAPVNAVLKKMHKAGTDDLAGCELAEEKVITHRDAW